MSLTGFVNIIKPTGMSSSDVVCKVKKILGTKKVGHLGTLDPAASGVLPLAVGRATKFFDYFLNKDKIYVARVQFGVETDTFDSFGTVTATDNKEISIDKIKSVLCKFIGKVKQIPPKYSAVKVGGKRAYELARNDISFEIQPREIDIFSIDVCETSRKNEFIFVVHCSAGTYIRTLMSDIAREINSISTTFVIIRTKSGLFDNKSALTLDELEGTKRILLVDEVFKNIPKIEVDEATFKKLVNGVKLRVNQFGETILDENEFFACFGGKLIGMYRSKDGFAEQIVYLYEEGE